MPEWPEWALLLALIVLLALASAGCGAKPAPVTAPTGNYWIPESLQDSDALCVPFRGGGSASG